MTYTVINEQNKEQAYALFNTALENLNNEIISLEELKQELTKPVPKSFLWFKWEETASAYTNDYILGSQIKIAKKRKFYAKIKNFMYMIDTFGTLHLSIEDMTILKNYLNYPLEKLES